MKSVTASLCILLFTFLLLISCGKGVRGPKATYTIKGQLVSRNDGTPIADFNLKISKMTGGLGLNEVIQLGDTYTDQNGIFYFNNISVKHNSQIEYDGNITTQTINVGYVPQNGDTINVGEVRIDL